MSHPRLLPADNGEFTGRRDVLERVWAVPRGPRDAGCRAMPVVRVTGRPWRGKTTLAVHATHALDGGVADAGRSRDGADRRRR